MYKGDFNGDGYVDLLCHSRLSGRKWIDYGSANIGFYGTEWQRNARWCDHPSGQLYIGDFNGDGRDDMMCHDVDNGYKWIDYANSAGKFYGTDWSRNARWCYHPSGQLYIGDFNGDGRDDMMCHDVDNGYKWIDYANSSGKFYGTDWQRNARWCYHASAQLLTGDFDGDGDDDLLCHDQSSGYVWVDYAFSAAFRGTNFERSNSFCADNDDRLYIGDANGDGKEDLICTNMRTTGVRVDYSATWSTPFSGTDWSATSSWCTGPADRIL